MCKWDIEITLKSGVMRKGVYEGVENKSGDVFARLFSGTMNAFNGIITDDMSNLWYCLGEVAAVEIKPKYD
jgi:hypothetical protein